MSIGTTYICYSSLDEQLVLFLFLFLTYLQLKCSRGGKHLLNDLMLSFLDLNNHPTPPPKKEKKSWPLGIKQKLELFALFKSHN